MANLAGAKPKVTVDKLLKRKPKKLPEAENLQQNSIAAGILEAIAGPNPRDPKTKQGKELAAMQAATNQALAAEKKAPARSEMEAPQARGAEPKPLRGPQYMKAALGDAPVSPDAARASLEKFRAGMRGLQSQIEARKKGEGTPR